MDQKGGENKLKKNQRAINHNEKRMQSRTDNRKDGGTKERPAANDKGRDELPTESAKTVSLNWRVPDGGWGWVVVASSLIVGLIVDGLSYTFGVFLDEFERAFQQPKGTIALANSLQVGVYLFIGPLVSALTNRFGCRPVMITGAVFAGLAFVASSLSTDVTMLILTYGLAGGIGFGLMYLPSIVAVSIYFEQRRAIATGLAVCGSGIGTFILAPLTEYLLSEYNWRWTLLLLSGLVFQGMVAGALVRPLKLKRCDDKTKSHTEEMKSHKDENSSNVLLNCGDGNVRQRTTDLGNFLHEDARKKAISTSSNSSLNKEIIPLINVYNENSTRFLSVPRDVATNKDDKSQNLCLSTPEMYASSKSQTSGITLGRGSHRPLHSNNPREQPHLSSRVRTQSSSDRTEGSSSPRAHTPVGLSLISLTDAQLNQVRKEVGLHLSRKDIHVSGPLAVQQLDITEEQTPGLLVRSVISISSLTVKDKPGDVTSRGLWSCLPYSARETLEEMLDLRILKETSYWCVLMGNFLVMLGMYVPFVYLPDSARQKGIEEDKAAFIISIIGITNTLGRVLAGLLINLLRLDCALVTSVSLGVAGIMTAICPFCNTYPTLATASAVFGACVAAYISLCSVLLCELLGVENLTNAFGFVILFRGVACIMGPPVAGAIIDATGTFDPSFFVGGGVIFLGALSHSLLLLVRSHRQKIRS